MRIAFIGAGHLARSLAPPLATAGHRIVAICSLKHGSARRLARHIAGARAVAGAAEAAGAAELVLLALPDRTIADVARRLARAELDWRARVVLHHAGAVGPEVLRPLRAAGAAVGVLHPLQCLGDPRLAAELLPTSRAHVSGDPRARRVARGLMRDLGFTTAGVRLDTSSARRAYHTAASLVSNDLVALFDLAVTQMQKTGLSERRAIDALVPLARGTLRHLEAGGIDAALTGPAARGDAETVTDHLRSLGGRGSAACEIHRNLSLRLARRARGAAAGRRLAATLARAAARGYSSES